MNIEPQKLWEKALASLNDEEKPFADPWKVDKRTFLLDLTKEIEEKRQICVDREWKLNRSERAVSIREIFGKMVSWINKFKEVGDIAVQYDPLHAALPWAACCPPMGCMLPSHGLQSALSSKLS